jgi:hypothetical protein
MVRIVGVDISSFRMVKFFLGWNAQNAIAESAVRIK